MTPAGSIPGVCNPRIAGRGGHRPKSSRLLAQRGRAQLPVTSPVFGDEQGPLVRCHIDIRCAFQLTHAGIDDRRVGTGMRFPLATGAAVNILSANRHETAGGVLQ